MSFIYLLFLLLTLLFSSVTQSCPTLCDPMDCSMPGFPGHCQLPEPAQTHVRQLDNAILPFHALSSPSLPALNLSQHQGLSQSQLFASGGQSIWSSASTSVLPMSIQGWFPLGSTGLISLQSKGLSRVFSSATVRKHQFFGTQPSLRSNSHIHIWLPGQGEAQATLSTWARGTGAAQEEALGSVGGSHSRLFLAGGFWVGWGWLWGSFRDPHSARLRPQVKRDGCKPCVQECECVDVLSPILAWLCHDWDSA